VKIKNKLFLGFATIILFIGAFGFYVSLQINNISRLSREIQEATKISIASLDFNVENFHTQLEVWEYVYEPTKKRLKAFELHNENLSKLLGVLTALADKEVLLEAKTGERDALCKGGERRIKEIDSNLIKVRLDWIALFEKVTRLRGVYAAGHVKGTDQYEKLAEEVKIFALANEDLFDELKFNSKVDEFVAAQQAVVKKLAVEQKSLVSGFKNILIIFISFLMVIGVGISLFISRAVTAPITKLMAAAVEIGKGKLDTKTGIKSKDEIGQLSRVFDAMTDELKESTTSLNELNKEISERKQAERNLQESEKNYRELVENANSVILRWLPDGIITFFNEFAQKFFGFEASEIIGKKAIGSIVPETKSTGRDLKQMVSGILKNPAKYEQNENENICKDGKRVWVNWTNRAIQDQNGNIIEVLSIGTDITERKQAEEKLGNSEERFRTVAEASADAILITNEERIIFWNTAATKMFGYEKEEVMGKLASVLIHDRLKAQNEEARRKLLKKETLVTDFKLYEGPCLKKDGTEFPVEATLSKLELGGQYHFSFIIRDITERKQAEEELIRLSTAIEQIRDTIVIFGIDGIVQYVNPALEKQLQYNRDELIGKDIPNFNKEISKEKKHEKVWETINKGELWSGNIIRTRKDGSQFTANVNISPVFNNTGKITCFTSIGRDITKEQQMEEQLRQAQKLEATATLASGLAHDFNNLLGGILNYISLAKEDINPKDEAFTCLSEVEKISIEAGNLTQKFITFSKGGRPGSAETVMNINEYLSDTVDLIVSGSNMECEYSFLENLRPVEIDKSQIRQAILNIIINSKEAMPDGGSLKITSKNVSINKEAGLPIKAGNYVKIIISDNGCGITKVNLPVIFDLYFSTKTKGTQKGTGLGLSTVYSIIKYHEGHISVESKEGVGTDVSIYLPVSQKPLVAQEVKEEPKTREDRAAVGPKRILFMDDEEFIRLPTKKILERMGHEVELACHGVEAIQKYAHARDSGHPFDVVILDLTIKGGMGGKQTIEELLKINPNVKAIVASGYSDDPVISNYKKYGFCASLPKPSSKDKMREALAKLC